LFYIGQVRDSGKGLCVRPCRWFFVPWIA